MSIFDIFRPHFQRKKNTNSASIARERLQIIVSHRSMQDDPDFLQKLRKELIEVIGKYVKIDPEHIKVQLGKSDNCATLELNVTLPNQESGPSTELSLQATTVVATETTQAPSLNIEQVSTSAATEQQTEEAKATTQQTETTTSKQKQQEPVEV